ncbi:30S ribosomal protein S11 [Patescibacteria group bacterium]|nr:30S ribosomal protein S11 [Patescibacteria group bacterium]
MADNNEKDHKTVDTDAQPEAGAKDEAKDGDVADTSEKDGKAEKDAKGDKKATGGKPAKTGKRRGKVRAPSPAGRAYIQASFNNTILSFTDHSGKVLTWGSPGTAGFKGTRKSTPYAATLASQQAAERAKAAGLKSVDVYVRGVGSGRDAAIRALQNSGIAITSLQDLTPTPHNGVRAKKPRRV